MPGLDSEEEGGGSSLAEVYGLGLSLIFLVPWTILAIGRMVGTKPSLYKLTRILTLGAAWYGFYHATCVVDVGNEAFDPHEILKLAPDASMKDIKRSYRKLSLVFHPDKATGDVQEFQRIAKRTRPSRTLRESKTLSGTTP